jgi:hypothetical protein
VAADRDADTIRLILTGDPSLAEALAVAVRVVGIRAGLTDDELDTTRDAVAAAFTELAGAGDRDGVVATIEVGSAEVWVELAAGGEERRITVQGS